MLCVSSNYAQSLGLFLSSSLLVLYFFLGHNTGTTLFMCLITMVYITVPSVSPLFHEMNPYSTKVFHCYLV